MEVESLGELQLKGFSRPTTVFNILWVAEEESNAELAKKVQNPITDLIIFPFQNNVNFGYGPDDNTQNILNIQPLMFFS